MTQFTGPLVNAADTIIHFQSVRIKCHLILLVFTSGMKTKFTSVDGYQTTKVNLTEVQEENKKDQSSRGF